MNRIVIFSGTTEGRMLAQTLSENGIHCIIFVATEYGESVMPEMDGLAATRRLRLDERFKSLPVIAMTAHSLSDEWRQCQEAGMNDYIAKPIDVPVLLSIVGKWMHTPVGAQNARL